MARSFVGPFISCDEASKKKERIIMFPHGTYYKYDNDLVFGDGKCKRHHVWITDETGGKVYDYEEALALTGNGRYNLTLLLTMSLSFLAMGLDIFSFSTVVALGQCDLQINLSQSTILMVIPFIGPITMAFAWEYISDTQGCRSSLLIAMMSSFIMSVLCAFAPNWVILGLFKLVGTCFCSGAQSATFALLGESCAAQHRAGYLIIMATGIHLISFLYFTPAYLISFLDFHINLGFITFVPWRLLVLILSLPLGISAVSIWFFYESPKFLLSAGKTKEALEVLRNISRRNGLDYFRYPVKKLTFNPTDHHHLSLLWGQTWPLFVPPLLRHTIILYSLIFVVHSTTGAIVVWLPFLAESFTAGVNTLEGQDFCTMIARNSSGAGERHCTSSVGLPLVAFTFTSAIFYVTISVGLSRLSSMKKTLCIMMFVLAALSSAGILVFRDSIVNIVMYFGMMIVMLVTGVISAYFVDIYRTSHLGMASCLGVVVGRISSVIGINWFGPLMLTHCNFIFTFWLCYLLSGAILSCLLPSDPNR